MIFSRTVSISGVCGFNCSHVFGRKDLVLRPINNWDGENSSPGQLVCCDIAIWQHRGSVFGCFRLCEKCVSQYQPYALLSHLIVEISGKRKNEKCPTLLQNLQIPAMHNMVRRR